MSMPIDNIASLASDIRELKNNMLDLLDFTKAVVELKQEMNEHMQLIHDMSDIMKTQQDQILELQKKVK